MKDRDNQELQALYATWADDALLRAISTERGQYREDVLPLIEAEAQRRGLQAPAPPCAPPPMPHRERPRAKPEQPRGIGFRIGIMAAMLPLAAAWAFIYMMILFQIHDSPTYKSFDAVCGGHADIVIVSAGLVAISLLCGFLQPVTDTPWSSGFVWCPFTWFALASLVSRSLLAVACTVVMWLACGVGMKLKACRAEQKLREEEEWAPS